MHSDAVCSPEDKSSVLSEIWGDGGGDRRFSKYPRIPVKELEKLRLRSDDPLDRYLEASKVDARKDDVVARLKADAEAGSVPAQELWSQYSKVPDWVDWERVKRGQRVFWLNAPPITFLLLHFTLIFGVAAPKINKVLTATGYLSRPTRVTFQRLLETTHWVLSCMADDGLREGSTGWEGCIRVRFLHASVRARLRNIAKTNPQLYNEAKLGIPINIEDMITTILGFAVGPLERLPRLGFYVSKAEREDFCHAWRYIAYLSGIPEDVNPLAKGADYSVSFEGSIVLHSCHPDDSTIRLAQALLTGMSYGAAELSSDHKATFELISGSRSTLPASVPVDPVTFEHRRLRFYGFYSQLTRIILNNKYCDFLGLPKKKIGWVEWAGAYGVLMFFAVLTKICRMLPFMRTWLINRNRSVLTRVIAAVLREKDPKFLLRYEPTPEKMREE
ncbi:hypothetical protein M427DRAFT_75316 [Gonapodya prolifera JEL478]|uniref:ER-bound oxygenase mpaB/mpaB'/Rubber oxygenase catalytic domain-containing protein n=1 Tax=Gonapodya prolifera (strain JEL478) TaxID=1344416 RepID=A0A138ZYE8_GONPJ|nr:hypothetical protein M427DRAFT_75316 [Gonapodya prolifera JEL478]|eukprot:KXS09532.1 hypothetical protein M427DRAFT_75316 [Gonapodya prolifera JEL478]